MDYDRIFRAAIDRLHEEGRYRVFIDILRTKGQFPSAQCFAGHNGPKPITVWCSNDYLGMGQHPAVVTAMEQALHEVGAGSGGTRNIGGNTHYHIELERELAGLHGKQSALLFTSGYVSNEAALSTLGRLLPGCVIFSDALNHASMIAGIRSSGCEKRVFRHNDLAHLEELLAAEDPDVPKLVAFESVYSMDGDIAPIAAICDHADRYGALTYLDDVHAVGMYGESGGGISERDGVLAKVDIVQGTLAKAFGVVGGYIASTATTVDFVRSCGSGFIFSTSMPPAIAGAALASIRHVTAHPELRVRHQERAATLKRKLATAGLPLMPSVTHIVPVFVGDAALAKQATDLLMERHAIYVQPINYPTVPRGTERLRLTPTPLHSDDDMARLVAALQDVWQTLGLSLRAAAE